LGGSVCGGCLRDGRRVTDGACNLGVGWGGIEK